MPESPLRLAVLALLWLAAAAAATALASALTAVPTWLHGAGAWRPDGLVLLLCATLPGQAVLLLASWRRAGVVGGGDRRAGAGLTRMRPGLLGLIAPLHVLAVVAWLLLVVRWIGPLPDTTLSLLARHEAGHVTALLAALTLVAVVCAPLAEELFFRGWLWTGLRRRWPVLPVAVATALPWLLLHVVDGGLLRAVVLVPAAVTFSVARHYGGVRTSLALHVCNNAAGIALLAASLLRA